MGVKIARASEYDIHIFQSVFLPEKPKDPDLIECTQMSWSKCHGPIYL